MLEWNLNGNAEIMAAMELAACVANENQAVVMVKGYNGDSANYTAIYHSELLEHQKEGGSFEDWIQGWSGFVLWYEEVVAAYVESTKIRLLNDAFRSYPRNFHMTAGVADKGQCFIESAANLTRIYGNFDAGNDSYNEHDFGTIMVYGQKCFWKIDYYDPTMQFGSENPADAKETKRVLTIMLANEY